MILEYADGGTLREYLNERFSHLKWKDKYQLGLDITNGLRYLHELDIIHKDLVCIVYVFIHLSNLHSCMYTSTMLTSLCLFSLRIIYLSNQASLR